MKCIYWANEPYQIKNSEGVMVWLESGDVVDIPSIPNDKVKQLIPYKEPEVVAPVTPKPAPVKKKKAPKKSSKK